MSDASIFIAGISLLILWTGTVASCLVWLQHKFEAVLALINSRVSTEDYNSKHESLSERVRELELWRAAKNGSVEGNH